MDIKEAIKEGSRDLVNRGGHFKNDKAGELLIAYIDSNEYEKFINDEVKGLDIDSLKIKVSKHLTMKIQQLRHEIAKKEEMVILSFFKDLFNNIKNTN